MFDIRWIRDNPGAFDAGLKRRGIAPGGEVKFSADLIALDEQRRAVVTRLQEAQARRNAASKEIGKAKGAKDEATAAKLMAEVAALKDALAQGEVEQKVLDKSLHDALSIVPNLPAEDVPDGADETGNKEIRKVGTPPKIGWTNKPLQHFEIGEALGLMDFETAAKLSGARFVVLKGLMARLERALASFMLDVHTGPEKDGIGGYTETAPPMLVRDEVMYGTGQLPKFEDDQYYGLSLRPMESPPPNTRVLASAVAEFVVETNRSDVSQDQLKEELARFDFTNLDEETWKGFQDFMSQTIESEKGLKSDLGLISRSIAEHHEAVHANRRWLIPTAEVPLTNLVREAITDEAELPMRVTAYTLCFRAEAGAAGKDTRGMIRQHQFSKVELVSITTPEQSAAEHERMTACAEEVLKRLGLAYRTMLLCTGDMGFAARKTYDIEVWLPGQNTYREISSCSVCGDFQARRMNARFRPKGAKETRFLHTLNGSGLAVGRTLIAILENYQQPDGSVAIPDALVPYMGGVKSIEKA